MVKVEDIHTHYGSSYILQGISLEVREAQVLGIIGRNLMTNPTLLLMAEPTEGLSPVMVSEVGRVIGKLRESGISILLVEQNLNFALRHADHIHVLERSIEEPERLKENFFR